MLRMGLEVGADRRGLRARPVIEGGSAIAGREVHGTLDTLDGRDRLGDQLVETGRVAVCVVPVIGGIRADVTELQRELPAGDKLCPERRIGSPPGRVIDPDTPGPRRRNELAPV